MGCGRAGESLVWISAGAERSRAAEAPEVRRSQRRDERATWLDVRHTRRRPNAGNRRLGKETTMSRWAGVTVLGAAGGGRDPRRAPGARRTPTAGAGNRHTGGAAAA